MNQAKKNMPKKSKQETQTVEEEVISIEPPKVANSKLYEVKMEAIRIIPLLLDAIRVLMSKRTITPVDKQIIKLRLESGSSLLTKIKGLDT
jgi:hypothetical protein